MSVKILIGDVRDKLRELANESVHCVVTSPPYWGLRCYGVDGQLGLEPTLSEHVAVMVEVFREVRRVLRKDGTLWLNYGDSYATSPPGNKPGWEGMKSSGLAGVKEGSCYVDTLTTYSQGQRSKRNYDGLKPKDLCGVPWRVAFALQADGWWLRQDIIWSKPNPMPESVTDRCTKAHEYLFLLSKSANYYYDAEAIKEAGSDNPITTARNGRADKGLTGSSGLYGTPYGQSGNGGYDRENTATRNKRSVWEIATAPFPEAHFATFPPALVEPCIRAGTSEKGCCAKCGAPWVRETERIDRGLSPNQGYATDASGGALSGGISASRLGHGGKFVGLQWDSGWSPSCSCSAAVVPATVLDPFAGAGTTGLVADRLQRNAVLIELNPQYAAMAEKRIHGDAPLFASTVPSS